MSILLLGGSPSLPSSSSRLLLHIGDRLAVHGHQLQRLHVRDLPAQALLHADIDDAGIRRAIDAVASAQAIVIATPVYKASYSGVLKAFLDLLPQDGLAGKLVLPLATGGTQSHMLALDYALRPVLHALAAKQVLTSIFATSQQLVWQDDDGLTLAPPIAARVTAGVDELVTALAPLTRLRAAHSVHVANGAPVRSLQDHPYTPASQAA
ncbi:NADPH-dependent FMN reductase [Massilia sp. Root418]|uniref:NADPH-dependent FMN reductase n=1 Tax=Massilia sp. Root418 TaxID=1736532 RepID=UPI0006FFDE66|nr:NADPH-dependent FMN reductase [Massilia sp. Root418]KQW93325.1 NADPH-dependent FMN reductase [Massilia sp. Root418]